MAREELIYWIEERERIRVKKECGVPKPWSSDLVFQDTYFCNVRREDDRVTKWVRSSYSRFVEDPMFEYNIILARFLNKPETLYEIGYRRNHDPEYIWEKMQDIVDRGETVWGNAYVITTHGIPMPKARYLVDNVLGGAHRAFTAHQGTRAIPWHGGTLAHAHGFLMQLEGLGSFLAAQIVADLKNTPHHSLSHAPDKKTFVAHGPGSLRGASWFHYGNSKSMTVKEFPVAFRMIRDYVDSHYRGTEFCNQDLQNCLCEFDKYMRVKTGTGRSKRGYNGAN